MTTTHWIIIGVIVVAIVYPLKVKFLKKYLEKRNAEKTESK